MSGGNPHIAEEARKGGVASGAARRAKKVHPLPGSPPLVEPQVQAGSEPVNGAAQRTPPLSTALGRGRISLSAEVYAQGWRFAFALLAAKRGTRWLLNDEEARSQGRLTKGVIDEYDWLQKTVGKLVEGHGELGLLAMNTIQLVGIRVTNDELERQLRYRAPQPSTPAGQPAARAATPVSPPAAPARPADTVRGPAGVEFERPRGASPAALVRDENAPAGLGDAKQSLDNAGASGGAVDPGVVAVFEEAYTRMGAH